MATFIHVANVRFFESGDVYTFSATSKARVIEVISGYLKSTLDAYDDVPEDFEDICDYCIDIGLLQVTLDISLLHEEQAEVK